MVNKIEIAKSLLSPPGDTIQETIDSLGMTQAELAERIGRPKEKVNEIIKGKERISYPTAFSLEKVLGIPASFWLNREKDYREQLFQIQEQEKLEKHIEWLRLFPYNELKKMGWLTDSKENHVKVNSLLQFFGIASPEEWDRIYIQKEVSVSFRISLANTKSPHAISAWLRIGEKQADNLNLSEYDKKTFRVGLKRIKELACNMPEGFAKDLQDLCASSGVAVVYTPNLPKAPISGATRWYRNKPLIQLSGRYKTDDHFWFSFFHEAAHILLHGKKDIFLENLEGTEKDQIKEKEADDFAANFLLKENEFKEIIASLPLNDEGITQLSDRYKISPGIIIGRLQHEKIIDPSVGNHHKIKINLFE